MCCKLRRVTTAYALGSLHQVSPGQLLMLLCRIVAACNQLSTENGYESYLHMHVYIHHA